MRIGDIFQLVLDGHVDMETEIGVYGPASIGSVVAARCIDDWHLVGADNNRKRDWDDTGVTSSLSCRAKQIFFRLSGGKNEDRVSYSLVPANR